MEQYNITGMSCAACAARIEKAVSAVSGVSGVSVNLLTNSMGVTGSASDDAIIEAVRKAGYDARHAHKSEKSIAARDEADKLEDKEMSVLLHRLVWSVIFLVPLMYISMGHMMWNWPLPYGLADNHVGMGLIQMLFTIAIMVINQKFFVSGVKGFIHKSPNMDTLVALGAGAAFIYSTYALYAMTVAQALGDTNAVMAYMHEFYFESAAMILTLITVGKLLEAYSKGRTTDALKSLMNLAPKMANVIRDGNEVQIQAGEIIKGDIFVVRPGESIPADGTVIDGSSAVDESALTGESIPTEKCTGSHVSASTINQSGFLRCEATRVGEDTTWSQIIKMVSDAAATKAPVAKIADKVSGIFVPVVIIIAVITILVWLLVGQSAGFALARGISVLVISCPCALGLATPVAIMVGNGVGARSGILFKTAASLEETGKVSVVVLDKTGTVTSGKSAVTDVIPCEGISEEELLKTACSIELKSEHPLAKAIVTYGKEKNVSTFDVADFKAVPGNGLIAGTGQDNLYAGNRIFIEKYISENTDRISGMADEFSKEGKTPLYFAKNGSLLGIIAVADVIRKDSARAVSELKNMGIRVVMLTGDNERTAGAIGSQAGVDEVIAGVLPDGKESVIRKLRLCGRVAMVGDGINDAPALTAADIGIAIGAGTDVAIDAADVVLMKSSLPDVPAAIRLSRRVLNNIHENLFWAFFYNSIGIPLAAGVFYYLLNLKLNPMFGAAAMSLSSFCVVTNALRINLVDIHNSKKDKKVKNKFKKKEVKIMEKTINIKGMMCGHCEMAVKKALEAIPQVDEAIVSHEKGCAVVKLNSVVSDEVLKKAVEEKDYEVISVED
ncbi:MAG: heavy metal translocating P-type ATPase [Lachnospiraceae bacterium]